MVRRPPAVARVLERVTGTVRSHEMLHAGDLVMVEVSGGPDSMCLLHALWSLRRLLKIRLAVFHFDHGLRSGSADDAAYVRRAAARLGVPFWAGRAAEGPAPGVSVEAWARTTRNLAAATARTELGATKVADGHTRDDQAETILMALVLGWGLDGLGGIEPVAGALVRPMLDVTRIEVEACCRALRLRPRRDPMNEDPRLLRNAIRLEAIPAIERATSRRVRDTFARTAGLVRADAEVLREQASALVADIVRIDGEGSGGAFAVHADAIAALPRPMASRVARRAFQAADLAWTEAAIDAVLDLAAGRPGRRRDLAPGIRLTRDREFVRGTGPTVHSPPTWMPTSPTSRRP